MKYKWKIGCSLIGGLIFSSTPAMALPALNGSWRITYYPDPNRNLPVTYCVAFTTTAGSIAGEPLSGSWQQPLAPGAAPGASPTWRGNWVQQGDQVKWWGNEGQYVTSHQGTLITSSAAGAAPNGSMTGQFQFFPLLGGTGGGATEVGAWSAQQVASCP
jgi:hypothetical protein